MKATKRTKGRSTLNRGQVHQLEKLQQLLVRVQDIVIAAVNNRPTPDPVARLQRAEKLLQWSQRCINHLLNPPVRQRKQRDR
jgi:hypothetical protein